MKKEIVDIRYVAKTLFLILTAFNLGHTFDFVWVGLIFSASFAVFGFLNASSRREFSKRPAYKKLFAYGAILPLALLWLVTPGVENGVNPMMIFLPGIYLLFLAVLQERSRGNGGFEVFVAFDGVAALLLSMYAVPKGWAGVGLAGLLLALFAYSRRGTAWYKYLLFVLLVIALGGISYAGWQHWKNQRYQYGNQFVSDYQQRENLLGFDPVSALGSFNSNYNGKYNDQVVLRVWDTLAPRYMKAAVYEKYMAGVWKFPTAPIKILTPNYYMVDYAVLEVEDSLTKVSSNGLPAVQQVWVQSTLKNFGFVFAPYSAVGFAVKDIDSLQYFPGNMVKGLDKNGKRSDWYYFACTSKSCVPSDSINRPAEHDLEVNERYYPLLDSVIASLDLKADSSVFDNILNHFLQNYTYDLTIPNIEHWKEGDVNALRDPLTVFLKEKVGYCEYYATLSTLLLRRLGMPARYVTGFANPEKVDGRPYATFRRKSSHAWVEVFYNDQWFIFDPTPPVVNFFNLKRNWYTDFAEGVKGRLARVMHFIKEGEWRKSLDSWQNRTQNFLDSGAPYAILAAVMVLLVVFRLYKYKKNNLRRVEVKSANAELWSKKLDLAEKDLARLGLRRDAGETVGTFAKRVQSFERQMDASSPKLMAQKERTSAALRILLDYERNRWRK